MTDYTPINPFATRTRDFDDNEQPTWADYGKELLATGQSIRASMAETSSYLAGKRGQNAMGELRALEAQEARAGADETRDGRTDAAKRASGSSPLEEEFWKHPIRATALKITSSLPYVAAMAVPAGIAGASLGAVAGMAAGTITSGYLGAGNLLSDVMERIDAADDATLRRDSTYYAGLRERLPENEARLEFRNFMAEGDGRLAIAALAEAAQGILGVGGMAARAAAGRSAVLGASQRGLAGRMGIAAATESGVETFQESVSNITKQKSLIAGELQKEFSLKEWADAAVEGMLLGGIMGAGFGIPGGARRPKETGVTTGNGVALDENLALGQNAAVTPEVTDPNEVPADIAKAMNAGTPIVDPKQPGSNEPTIPETAQQLKAQVDDLRAGVRDVVYFPLAIDPQSGEALPTQPKRPSMPRGMKRLEIDGNVFYFNPKKVDEATIREKFAAGRLNDILPMGPTSKAKAEQDIEAGAEPLVVSTKKPDGTRVTEQATSSATVDADVQAQREQAAEGDLVEVEDPGIIMDRLKGRQAERQAQQAPTVSDAIRENDQIIAEAFKDKPIVRRVAELHAQGLVAKEISEATGLDVDTVRAIRRTLGLEAHGPAGGLVFAAPTEEPNPTRAAAATPPPPAAPRPQPMTPAMFSQPQVDNDIAARKAELAAAERGEFAPGALEAAPVTPPVTPPAPTGPRILQAADPEADAATKKLNDEIARRAKAAENIKNAKEAGTKNRSKKEKEERKALNDAALEVTAKPEFMPSEGELLYEDKDRANATKARAAIMKRARAIVQAMADAGFDKFPRLQKNSDPEMELNAAAARVSEAQVLVKKGAKAGLQDFRRFLSTERALLSGDREAVAEIREERRQQADDRLKRAATTEDAAAVTTAEEGASLSDSIVDMGRSPEDIVDEKLQSEFSEQGPLRSQEEVWEEGQDRPKATETIAQRLVNERKAKARELAERGATEGEREAGRKALERLDAADTNSVPVKAIALQGTDKTGTFAAETKGSRPKFDRPKVEGKVSLTRRVSDPVRPRMSDQSSDIQRETPEGDIVTGQVLETTSLGEVFDQIPGQRGLVGKINEALFERKIRALVEDVPVYIVDPDSDLLWDERSKAYMDGYYDPTQDHIVLSAMVPLDRNNGKRIVLHEAVHAAYEHKISTDPNARAALEYMLKKLRAAWQRNNVPDADLPYGLRDIHELISEALSNPRFQSDLSEIKVTPEVRREMRKFIGPQAFRLRDYFEMFRAQLRHAFGLGSDAKTNTMLDEIIQVTNRLDQLVAEQGRRSGAPTSQIRPSIGNLTSKLPSEAQVRDWMSPLRAMSYATDTTTMLAQRAEALGGKFGEYARRADELRNRMVTWRDEWLRRPGGAGDIAQEGERLRRQFGDQKFQQAMDLGFSASEYSLTLHKKGEANPNKFSKDGTADWQRKAQYPRLQAQFEKIDSALQDYLLKAARFGQVEGQAALRKHIETLLDAANVQVAGLTDRIIRGQMTDIDEKQFATNIVVKHLKKVANQFKRQGWYFPFNREGDFVVNARIPIRAPTTAGVVVIDTGTFHFTDPAGKGRDKAVRRLAEAYASRQSRPTEVERIWVDKNNPSKEIDGSDVDAVRAYRVIVDDQYTSFHTTEAEAREISDRLTSQGYADGRVDKRAQALPNSWGGFMPRQYAAVIESLEKQGKFSKMTEAQQNVMLQAMHEANLRLLPGSRFQHHKIHRRNVAGYNTDMINAISTYGQQSASYLAKMEFQPEIDKQIKGMMDEVKNTNDKDNVRRQELVDQLEGRMYSSLDSQDPKGILSTIARRLNQTSMLNKLAGVSYPIINSTEPWLIAAPLIAGRHGTVRSVQAIKRAYGLVGAKSGIGAGFRDTVAAWSQDGQFTDYRSSFKAEVLKNISDPAQAARVASVLDFLYERQLFGTEAGMELQRLTAPSTNAAGRALDRAELMFRQVNQALEAINRSVAGIAAYEMEYSRTKDHEASLRYAHDIVHDSMGNYAASNAAPIFNSTFGRLTLQFKKFPQRMYYLLGKTFKSALRGDPEGMKQFAGLMFTHAVTAGLMGLPLEPVKIALMAAGFFGLGFSYEDFEDLVYQTVAGVSPAFAEVATKGLPRAFGVDLSGRIGLDGLLTFGQPRTQEQRDLKAWLFDTIAGAPIGTVLNMGEAVQKWKGGDILAGVEKTPVPKFAVDAARATRGALYGKETKAGRQSSEEYSVGEAIIKGIGFAPARESREREAKSAYFNITKRDAEQRAEFRKAWIKATPNERMKLWGKIEQFNKTVPREARITREQLNQAAKRRENETSFLGSVPNRTNEYVTENIKRLYRVN
jgi:hypothetical protein